MRSRAAARAARTGLALTLAAALLAPPGAHGEPAAPGEDVVLAAMGDEIARSMASLSMPGVEKPYYVAYAAVDVDHTHVAAAYGALYLEESYEKRMLEVDVRVGDYALDSSRAAFERTHSARLPVDDDYAVLRHAMWLATDEAYKRAAENLEKKKAAKASSSASEDDVADYSAQKPEQAVAAPARVAAELSASRALVKQASLVFAEFPEVQHGEVDLSTLVIHRRFANSEGSRIGETIPLYKLHVVAWSQAEDGMHVQNFTTFLGRSMADLPNAEALAVAVRQVAGELRDTQNAEKGESYSGPVLFEGPAAGQLMRAVLGGNLSGTPPSSALPPPLRRENELVGRLGKDVLPAAFSVHDDPTLATHDGVPLAGHYRFDDEGVAAQRVSLVKNGELETLLMSRVPRKEVSGSNGHGRGPLATAAGTPANLFIEARGGSSPKALRKKLVQLAKKAGEEYGLVVRRLEEPSITGVSDWRSLMSRPGEGGGAQVPDPAVALRVYADGREEPVRGIKLGRIQARVLREIQGWTKARHVENFGATHFSARDAAMVPGMSFALSQLPMSVVTPDLLFEEVHVEKLTGPFATVPLYPHPQTVKPAGK